MRRILLLALVLAGCSHTQIRKGPPLRPVFAPPPGLVQLIRTEQDRTSKVVFIDDTSQSTSMRELADMEERYERLPDGGYRVSRTLTARAVFRDNQPVSIPDPFIGVTEKFVIDAQGRYLSLENGDDVIQQAKARTANPAQRKFIDVLSADALNATIRDSWQQAYGRVCGHDFAPGAVSYAYDSFAEPAIDAPIHDLVQETVVGRTEVGVIPAVEFDLKYFGAESDLMQPPEVHDFLASLPPAQQVLTGKVEGKGSRIVIVPTCQTYSEESFVHGDLPSRPTNIPSVMVPKNLHFEVHRRVLRLTPTGAM